MGHLVDETEYAVIGALTNGAHKTALKVQTQRLIFFLVYGQLHALALGRFCIERQLGTRSQLLIVDYIPNRASVDSNERPARIQPGLRSGGEFINADYPLFHIFPQIISYLLILYYNTINIHSQV